MYDVPVLHYWKGKLWRSYAMWQEIPNQLSNGWKTKSSQTRPSLWVGRMQGCTPLKLMACHPSKRNSWLLYCVSVTSSHQHKQPHKHKETKHFVLGIMFFIIFIFYTQILWVALFIYLQDILFSAFFSIAYMCKWIDAQIKLGLAATRVLDVAVEEVLRSIKY